MNMLVANFIYTPHLEIELFSLFMGIFSDMPFIGDCGSVFKYDIGGLVFNNEERFNSSNNIFHMLTKNIPNVDVFLSSLFLSSMVLTTKVSSKPFNQGKRGIDYGNAWNIIINFTASFISGLKLYTYTAFSINNASKIEKLFFIKHILTPMEQLYHRYFKIAPAETKPRNIHEDEVIVQTYVKAYERGLTRLSAQ